MRKFIAVSLAVFNVTLFLTVPPCLFPGTLGLMGRLTDTSERENREQGMWLLGIALGVLVCNAVLFCVSQETTSCKIGHVNLERCFDATPGWGRMIARCFAEPSLPTLRRVAAGGRAAAQAPFTGVSRPAANVGVEPFVSRPLAIRIRCSAPAPPRLGHGRDRLDPFRRFYFF